MFLWQRDTTLGMRGKSWRRKGGMLMGLIGRSWRNKLVMHLKLVVPEKSTLIVATVCTPAVERFLMEILNKNDIEFMVAPVSAKAQVSS